MSEAFIKEITFIYAAVGIELLSEFLYIQMIIYINYAIILSDIILNAIHSNILSAII